MLSASSTSASSEPHRVRLVNDDSHRYYSMEIRGDQKTSPTPASFIDSRSIPILDKSSDYHMAVARLSIPANSIPLMVWPDDPNYYQVRFVTGTGAGPFTVHPAASLPQLNPLNYTPAAIFDVQTFFESLNRAITTAFIAAGQTVHTGPGGYSVSAPADWSNGPPIFIWRQGQDQQIGLQNWTIHLSDRNMQTADQTTAQGGVWFQINNNLYQLLSAFRWRIGYGVTAAWGSAAAWYQPNYFVFTDGMAQANFTMLSTYFSPTPNPSDANSAYNVWYFQADWDCSIQLSSLQNIQLQTSIPMEAESFRPAASASAASSDAKVPILQDFEPDGSNGVGSTRTVLQYIPQQFRYLDLRSSQALNNIEIAVFWTDKRGVIRPVMLLGDQVITIKVMFERKPSLRVEHSDTARSRKKKSGIALLPPMPEQDNNPFKRPRIPLF